MSVDTGKRQVTVIGAGIVGICCALYLQRDGHRVTVIDREAPGEGCSKGNLGIFAIDHGIPHAKPGILAEIPGMLLDPLGPLTLRWSYLPWIAPWLARFIRASFRDRFEPISIALQNLNRHALKAYDPLIKSAEALDLVVRRGWLLVYGSDRSYQRAKKMDVEVRRSRGVNLQILSSDEVQELEPALSPGTKWGVLFPDVAHCTNPYRFVQVLAEDFRRKGGNILQEKVTGFTVGPGGPSRILTEAGAHGVDVVVLAAGAYSREMARQLGSKVPLDTHRGYHVMVAEPNVELRVPVLSGDFHFGITSMEEGLCVGGTVELAGIDAPPNYARADKLLGVARRILPGLRGTASSRWMGCRPSLPDSLPVLGRSPHYSSVYFAFGHGHTGLTQGAITGKLIAEMVMGTPTTIDVHPYRVDRF